MSSRVSSRLSRRGSPHGALAIRTARLRVLPGLALLLVLWLTPRPAAAGLKVVIIEGLGGQSDYAQQFDSEVRALAAASRSLTDTGNVRVLAGAAATRSAIVAYLHGLTGSLTRTDRLIVYLVGHGSYDGRQYKLNLPGPDLSGEELAGLLDALPASEQLVVATGSCSGALLPLLQRPGRVLITATRSGDEKNATRFGEGLAAAVSSPAADSDKNGAISVREAYDFANRRVQDYYRAQTLLATEHAVLQGDQDVRFIVATLSPTTAASEGAAGAATGKAPPALLRERDALHARIEALEQRKASMPAAQYSTQLEQLLLQLAQLQQNIDQAGDPHGGAH